jgi:hypothetical protein
LTEPALLFQHENNNPAFPAGLVEIVSEVKDAYTGRLFLVRYTDPWMSGADTFVAYGSELQLTT